MMKDKLILYNKEDCLALMKVKDLIYAIVENENTNQCNDYETVYPEAYPIVKTKKSDN